MEGIIKGAILMDRYRILKPIGKGGMSEVYLAENIRLGNLWAVKAVRKDGRNPVHLLAEPNILKNLNHPALPRIVDISETDERFLIVMDYVRGTGLNVLIEAGNRFDEKQIIAWGIELCDVLGYLHTRTPAIIYRDLKPANIIVDENKRLKLIDFGIAVEVSEEDVSSEIYLTRGYAAPEQYTPEGQRDPRIDIYALGATLYHTATGIRPGSMPYPYPGVHEVRPDLSDGLDAVLQICMKRNPDKRFHSAEEVRHALSNIHKYNSAYREEKKRYYRNILLSAGALCVSFGLLFTGIGVRNSGKEENYRKLIVSGTELAEKGKYAEAESVFAEASKIAPGRIEGYLGSVNTMLLQYRYDDALDYAAELLEQYPEIGEDARFNALLGRIYRESGNSSEAGYYYETAARQAPEETVYMEQAIMTYTDSGSIEHAEQLLQEYLNAGGSEAFTAYLNVGIAAKQGKAGKAAAIAEDCIRLAGDDEDLRKSAALLAVRALLNDAGTGFGDDVLNRAEQLLLMADAGTGDPALTEELGTVYYKKAGAGSGTPEAEYLDKAADCFSMLLERGYKKAYLYRNIIIIRQTEGQFDEAEKILGQMLDNFPDDYDAWHQAVLLYLEEEYEKPAEERNFSRAEEAFRKASALSRAAGKEEDLRQLEQMMQDAGAN